MFRDSMASAAGFVFVVGAGISAAAGQMVAVLPECERYTYVRAAVPSIEYLIRNERLTKTAGLTADQKGKLALMVRMQRDECRQLGLLVLERGGTEDGEKAIRKFLDNAKFVDDDRWERTYFDEVLDERQRQLLADWQIAAAGMLAPLHPKFHDRFGTTPRQVVRFGELWPARSLEAAKLSGDKERLAVAAEVAADVLTPYQKSAVRSAGKPPDALAEVMAGWLEHSGPGSWHIDEAHYCVAMLGGLGNVLDCAAARKFAGLTPSETTEVQRLRDEHRELLKRLGELQGTRPHYRVFSFLAPSATLARERRAAERAFALLGERKALKLQAVAFNEGGVAHVLNGMMIGVQLTNKQKMPLAPTPRNPYGDWNLVRAALSPEQLAILDRIRAVKVPEEVAEAYAKFRQQPRLGWEK